MRSQYRSDPEPIAAIQKQLREREAAHPEDPLALDLYASALRGTDTPDSIRMLEKAQTLAPGFAWPSLDLAQIYSNGKFADKPKFTDQLTKFWTACPTSQDQYARWMLVKVPELQAQVAKAERTVLERETDPERLKDYEFLWGLEFRTTSPQKFPELRQQVAEDVKRLERSRNPNSDAEWAQSSDPGEQAGRRHPCVNRRERRCAAREVSVFGTGLWDHLQTLDQDAPGAGGEGRRCLEDLSPRSVGDAWAVDTRLPRCLLPSGGLSLCIPLMEQRRSE